MPYLRSHVTLCSNFVVKRNVHFVSICEPAFNISKYIINTIVFLRYSLDTEPKICNDASHILLDEDVS